MASEPDGIAGTWHPPGSSRAVVARLLLRADGTVAADATDGRGMLAGAPAAAIAVSDRVGRIPRRVTFPDGSLFETSDNDGIDRLLAGRIGRGARLVAGLEAFRPRLAALAAAIVALAWAIWRFAVPAMVELAVAVTPPVVPELMSRAAFASIDETFLAPSRLPDDRRRAIVGSFGELAAHGARGPDGYALHFRDGGMIGANAFALPDGTILVTDQLVALAEGDEDAILGVLGHEIGHVDGAHSLRRLYRAAGVAGLIMLIGGDIGGGAEDLLVQGSALLSLSFSRDQEREADRYGVDLLAAAGRDPMAVARFFERLAALAGDGVPGILSSHPATRERIEATRRYAGEALARRAGGG